MKIRSATLSEQSRVLGTLTLAFAADPVIRYWWPDASEYLDWWPRFALAIGNRGFEAGSVIVGGEMEAVSMWLPPGVEPDPTEIEALNLPGSDEEEEIAAELHREMDRLHPSEPHWYLWTLGVDPRRQRRGLGSELLAHTLAIIDQQNGCAYLEASDPKNVPFYVRHGFEPLGVVQVRDVPPITPMVRQRR